MYKLQYRIIIISALILWCITRGAAGQYSGLRFNGHEVPLDQRTSLNLTPTDPVRIGSEFELSFELKFEPDRQSYFGYIFRILLDGENYDFIYSPPSIGMKNLHLIIGEKISNISFYVPLEHLTSNWCDVKLKVDGPGSSVVLQFNDSLYSDKLDQKLFKTDLHLFFGAHRFKKYNSTDLPNMNLRSVKLASKGNLIHHWPLNQASGTKVIDLLSSSNAKVTNPTWILDMHTKWRNKEIKTFDGRISNVYDQINDQLIVATDDSIIYFNMENGEEELVQPNKVFLPSTDFHLITDPVSNDLFIYSADLNKKIALNDFDNYKGNYLSNNLNTNLWHHNKIINPLNQVLFLFGGYGQLTYSNHVLRFNDTKDKWDTLDYSGIFHPRYLAGMGYNKKDKHAYIIGGYGSITGKQEINPGYYYDLIKYSFKANDFETVAKFDESLGDFCFSNSIFIDSVTNMLYGLKFSKHEANPKLQAVSISLDDFTLTPVGEAINFRFLDVNSSIDLYVNESEQKLYAITSYFDNENTDLHIHEISYPPVGIDTVNAPIEHKKKTSFILLLIILVLVVLAVIIIRVFRKDSSSNSRLGEADETIPPTDKTPSGILNDKKTIDQNQPTRPGSITIFGGFQVINKSGEEITASFTPLLKELFLLIMLNSLRKNKGVSSEKLNEIFWFNKSAQSARNNRAVNLAKLRMILDNIGECQISKETGYWKFFFDPKKVYIDYYEYLQLAGKAQNNSWTKNDLLAILTFVKNGPALSNIDAEWLDEIKADISNEIIDGIISYITRNKEKKDPEFIIELTNCIFDFDMANEEAMIIKCKTLVSLGKHSLAKNAYSKFEKEYEVLYGEKYSLSFNKVLSYEN